MGAVPSFATDGREAIEALRTLPFDVVLMDKHMPVMDGIEATRRIRSSGFGWCDVPIVALTADAMEGERERMLDAGMDGFATKPIRMDDLGTAIADARRKAGVRSRTPAASDHELTQRS